MSDDPLDGMRARIEKCRRLAGDILDSKASAALLQMARDIECDLAKLEAERAAYPKHYSADLTAEPKPTNTGPIFDGGSDSKRPLPDRFGH